MNGIELITKEREEQLSKHGRTVENDYHMNDSYQLVSAARALMPITRTLGVAQDPPSGWDSGNWNKMYGKRYKDRLIIAGALIAAELDRVQMIEGKQG